MYVRVKRRRQTIFLHVEPSETILEVKQKVQALVGQGAEDMRLLANGVALEDARTLTELKVENDAVLALAYRKYDSTEFEEVEIETLSATPAEDAPPPPPTTAPVVPTPVAAAPPPVAAT